MIKSANKRNLGQACLFYTEENTQIFDLEDNDGKLSVEFTTDTFLDVVATVDVLTESNKKTCLYHAFCMTIKLLFARMNKLDHDY